MPAVVRRVAAVAADAVAAEVDVAAAGGGRRSEMAILKSEGTLHRGAAPGLCGHRHRAGGSGTASEPRADFCGTSTANAGSARHHSRDRAWPFRSRRARHHGSCEPGPAAPDPVQDARRRRIPQPLWHPRAVASSRRASLCVRRARPRIPSELSSRQKSDTGMFGGNSELARSDLDAGERVVSARPAAVLFVSTGTRSKSNVQPAPAT